MKYRKETVELLKEAYNLPLDLECKLIINLAKMVYKENGYHDIEFKAVRANGKEVI